MTTLSDHNVSNGELEDLNWLLESLCRRTSGVLHAIVVSSDGLLMSLSPGLARSTADQLGAVTAGLASLTRGAARCFEGGAVRQVMVDMEQGFLFVTSISDGSSLAVVAADDADVGVIGYEMATFVNQAGRVLSPALVAELRARLPR